MMYLDSAVLNVTERLCRRFQIWTGWTNVWLAFQLTNLSVVVYFIWAVAFFWQTSLTLRVVVGAKVLLVPQPVRAIALHK